MPPPNDATVPLLRAVKRTRLRLVLADALQRFARLLPLPLIYMVVGLAAIKLLHPSSRTITLWAWGTLFPVAIVIISVLALVVRGRSALVAAVLLDRVHGLRGRVANAVAFSRSSKRTPFEVTAIEDATRFADRLSPAVAAPIPVPRQLWLSGALLLGLLVLSKVEVQHARIAALPAEQPAFTPFTLSADDQALLEEKGRELAQTASDPEVAAVVRRFNQLVEDMAQGRLDRKQVLQQMDALQQALVEGSALEREALDESLRELGESLRKHRLTKAAGDALAENELPDAEEALRKLAERLRNKPEALSKQELQKLRDALEAASRGNAERLTRLEAQRQAAEQTRERLLKKKEQAKTNSERRAADEALAKQDRELKRLDRQKRKAQSAARQMSELDRQLAQAARDLMKEMGEAAKSIEAGAESLNRTAQRQLSDQEKEALKKQLQELKELLRQAKSGNAERQKQLERFRQRARGGKPGDASGTPGQRPGTPELKLGAGQGSSLEIPVPGQGKSEPGAGGKGGQGEGAGATAGGEVRGEPTDLKGKTQDVAAAGIDSGQGTASSEVVYGAASRGFTAGGYRKVYTDYKAVAEEVLESDEIPAGYKFYVRRYFQLIRPRE